MMTLDQYLKTEEVSQSAFAEKIGTTQAHISRLCAQNSAKSPSPAMAAKIESATDGKVPHWSWPAFKHFAPKGDAA